MTRRTFHSRRVQAFIVTITTGVKGASIFVIPDWPKFFLVKGETFSLDILISLESGKL